MQETEETQIWSQDQEDPLEEGMATRSSIFAWRISWTEEPDRLQSIGSQRVGHDWGDLAQKIITIIPIPLVELVGGLNKIAQLMKVQLF